MTHLTGPKARPTGNKKYFTLLARTYSASTTVGLSLENVNFFHHCLLQKKSLEVS